MNIIELHILAQALTDVLEYELKKMHLTEEEYEDALLYILRYPTLRLRLKKKNKEEWLEELYDARGWS